jgi:hypothetical protein
VGRFIGRLGVVSLPAVEVGLKLDERVVRRHVAKLEAAGWLGRTPGLWGEGSVAWLTARGLTGAGLGGLRPVKVPPRPATMAHAVLVGWSAARVQRRGRPWRSARELALDAEQWAIRVRGERGASRYRLPDLAVWLHASKPPVAVVVDAGLARADRQRAILEGWRDAIESGQYVGVRYECTSESVAERVADVAERVQLNDPELFVTVQPTRDGILEPAAGGRDSEDPALRADQPLVNPSEAAEGVQLSLLGAPALTPAHPRHQSSAPVLELPQPPEPSSSLTAEERERRYRELLDIQEQRRLWWPRR